MTTLPPIYDIDGLAHRLRLPNTKWLQRNLKSLPHSRMGDARLFTEEDVAEILRITHHDPEEAQLPKPQLASRTKSASAGATGLTPIPRRRPA